MAIAAGLGGVTVGAASAPSGGSEGFTFGTGEMLMVSAVFVLVFFAGFLAMAETALTRMSRIRALSLEEEGRRGAGPLRRLVEHPERFLNPLLLLVLGCHLVMSTLVGLLVERAFGAIGVVVAVLLEVVVIFVASEAGPKTWAVQHSDRAALLVAPVIAGIVRFPPIQALSRFLIWLSNVLLPGKGLKHGPATTEQELLAMADAAVEEDVIEREERSMIHSVIEFGDTVAREVMVPRPDMVAVDADATVSEAATVAIQAGYSRLPVIGESKDDVAGLVHAKDIMRALQEGKDDAAVSTLARPVHYCPESKRVSELMREMQAQKFHMAVVVDEYGGTAGLVTLEDLIEELVGEIVDEYDVEEAQYERLPNGELRVDSRMLIDDLNDLLGVEWPSQDWDSVGGLVFNRLGHVASEGETVEYEGHLLRAEKVKGRRIGRVRISRMSEYDERDLDHVAAE